MKFAKNKTIAIAIAIFLTLSMSASMMLVPTANAHTPPWQIATMAFLNVAPNPIGVGQTLTVNFWLQMPPPTAGITYGDRWENITVKVTLPDGTTTTLGPFASDDTGGTFTTYTPTQLGNYTFQMSFPGQTLAGNNPPPAGFGVAAPFVGDYFGPSVSNTVKVTVQKEPIPSIPLNPLPTSYWTRPISAENNNWYSIAGNWLGMGGSYNASGNYNPWSTAPTTAHILWTKPIAFGGTVGGEFGGSLTSNFYTNRQYETPYEPIIMNGILYYTEYPTGGSAYMGYPANNQGWAAVNLQTGQTIWTDDSANYGGGSPEQTALISSGICTYLACGQLLNFVSPNQYGCQAFLWSTGTPDGINAVAGSTTWNMFDAFDGKYLLSIVNGTGLTLTEDQNGDLIGYYINFADNTLNMWNSTWCIQNYDNITGMTTGISQYTNPWMWRPIQGSQIPFSDGIEWSEPIATNYSGNALPGTLWPGAINSGVIIMSANNGANGGGSGGMAGGGIFQSGYQIEAGYSADTGAQLWITNRTETPYTSLAGPSSFLDGCGVYVVVNQNTLTATGYSIYTGAELWTKVLPNANTYDTYMISGMVANGTLYMYALGGDVYAMNIQTGTILWHYTTGSAEYNTPYGVWPIWAWNYPSSEAIADGVLFINEGHEYSPPLFRGAQVVALNLTDGQPIWNDLGFYVSGGPAISDGVLVMLNSYDNQLYSYGMGPSKTTVTAPSVGVTTSTPLTITGTVTDISAGSQQEAPAANFPNGLPCVSDVSMTQWMDYVYQQQPMPTNATGVPVTISVVDSNGNYRTIGTATSNVYGTYSLTWTPDIPGNYTVIASFAGSGSYYGSSATTAFYASAAPATPSPYPVTVLPPTEMYIGVAAVAIIVVIIIGFALLFLTLRKRP